MNGGVTEWQGAGLLTRGQVYACAGSIPAPSASEYVGMDKRGIVTRCHIGAAFRGIKRSLVGDSDQGFAAHPSRERAAWN